MNPSPVTLSLNLHNPLHDLEPATPGTAAVRMTSQARLERVHADRALILERLEATPAPPYAAMPSVSAGTTVVVNAMAVPAQGYADPGEPLARTGPVDPGPDATLGASSGGAEGAQGLVALTSSSATKRELAFLDDRSLPIEEKLFQFMVLMTKKADQDLVAYMKEVSGKKSSSSSGSGSSTSGSSGSSSSGTGSGTGSTTGTSGSSGSGGATGAGSGDGEDLGDQIGAEVESLTKRYTGPALGAVATAFGFPELIPVASALGSLVGNAVGAPLGHVVDGAIDAAGDVAGEAFDAVGGAFASIGGLFGFGDDDSHAAPDAHIALPRLQAESGLRVASSMVEGVDEGDTDGDTEGGESPAVAKATSSGTSSSTTTSAVDEKIQVFQLQRLLDKQSTMFEVLSNVLKSLHDARMAAVQNLR